MNRSVRAYVQYVHTHPSHPVKPVTFTHSSDVEDKKKKKKPKKKPTGGGLYEREIEALERRHFAQVLCDQHHFLVSPRPPP